jgi:hypothetical protein
MPIKLDSTIRERYGPEAHAKAESYLRALLQSAAARLGARSLATTQPPPQDCKWYGATYELGPVDDWLGARAPESTHVFKQFGWILPDYEVSQLCGSMADPNARGAARPREAVQAIRSAVTEIGIRAIRPDTILAGLDWVEHLYQIMMPLQGVGHPSPIGRLEDATAFVSPGVPSDSCYLFSRQNVLAWVDPEPTVKLQLQNKTITLDMYERFGIRGVTNNTFKVIRLSTIQVA